MAMILVDSWRRSKRDRTMPCPALRRQAWLLSLVICSALLALGCSSKPQLPHLRQDATILAFGDSLTFGTGAEPEQSYPAVLSRKLTRTVVNAGVPGETSSEGLIRLPGVLDDTHPDLVILCLGGNDFLQRKEIAQTRDNLARMVEMIQARHISVVLIAVPQPRLLLHSEALYGELAKKYHVPVEDDVLAAILRKEDLKSDAIHPNAAGYRKLAEALSKLLLTSGAI